MLKVLHVIPSVASIRGGTSQAALEMVKALRDQAVDARIITTNDNGPEVLDVPLKRWIEYIKVPVYFFPRFSPRLAALREFAFSSQLTIWLWSNLQEYDLLHVHALFSYPSTLAMALARWQGSPYVVTPHGLLCTWSLQQSQRKKRFYLRCLEQTNLNHARMLHFTAQQEHQEATHLGLRPPTTILPLGLTLSTLQTNSQARLHQLLNIPLDELIILFLSRLHPKKGLALLLPALAALRSERFAFVLAGNGDADYEAEVKAMIATMGLQERTHWLGFVQGDFKDLVLQGADLLVLPSYSENFGVVVLEALAAGTPVLVTPGVALADMIHQQQLGYVAELNVPSIMARLADFFAHQAEAKAMGERAHQFISYHYAWTPITRQLIDMYTTILKKEQPQPNLLPHQI